MRVGIAAIGIALSLGYGAMGCCVLGCCVLGCGAPAAERPRSARPPTDPRLRALWDRALVAESARAEALAGLLRDLELHRGTLRARDDQGRLGDDHQDGRIEGTVLAIRSAAEGPEHAILGESGHFRLWMGEGSISHASLILPHGATGGSIAECAGCVEWGERSIIVHGTFRGRYGDGSPLAIEIEGTLERVALSQLSDRELETLLPLALARQPLAGTTIHGHVLSLEVSAESLEDPESRAGESCALALGYRSRIELDLRVLARRGARIVWAGPGIERCCAGERVACSPGPTCRERPLDAR